MVRRIIEGKKSGSREALSVPPQNRVREVAAASLLWAGFAFKYARPTMQQFVFASNIGNGVSMFASALGILVMLIVIGFLGAQKRPNLFFILGAVFCWLNMLTYPLSAFEEYVDFLSVAYYFCGGAASAFFIVGCCQYYSLMTEREKRTFIAPSFLFAFAIVLILFQLPSMVAIVSNAFIQTIAAFLFLRKRRPSVEEKEPQRSPKSRFVMYGAFGLTLGFLMVVCSSLAIRNSISFEPGNWFTLLWIVVLLVFAIILWIFLGKPRKNAHIPRAQQLLPLIVLGFLAPPFLAYGIGGIFPLAVVFAVVGELIIFSLDNPGVYRLINVGKFCFVFWERSSVLIGFALGGLLASLVLSALHFEVMYAVLFVAAFIYLVLCLITVLVSSKGFDSSSEKGSYGSLMETASSQIGEDYKLTPREKEVFRELASGRSVPYIQEKLCISEGTAASHINHIHQKLGIHRRQELHDLVQRYLDESADE